MIIITLARDHIAFSTMKSENALGRYGTGTGTGINRYRKPMKTRDYKFSPISDVSHHAPYIDLEQFIEVGTRFLQVGTKLIGTFAAKLRTSSS